MNPTEKIRRQAEITRAGAPENRTRGPAREMAVTAPKRARPGERARCDESARGGSSELIGNESRENSYGVPEAPKPAPHQAPYPGPRGRGVGMPLFAPGGSGAYLSRMTEPAPNPNPEP